MKSKEINLAVSLVALAVTLAALLWAAGTARAARPAQTPTITGVSPGSAPNDLDTNIIITGTDFAAVPTITLGTTVLDDVGWVSAGQLTATVPWGLDPGIYTVTVENPGGESGSVLNAFTVTQGIGVWNATELYGGDVNEVAVNPQTPETLYAVSPDVGLFRSTNGAATWDLLVAGGEYSVRTLAIDPVSPTVLYAFLPWDLHRSDDGGDTWTPLNAPGEIPFPHPTDSGTLFVSNRWEGESGLWKSTDSGQTWLTMTTGLTDTRVNNLVFDPTDPMTIYAGTELGNLFVSGDGGASWNFVDHPLDYIGKLAINPRGDHELWASNCCFCNPNTTLRSTNATHTAWITVAEPVGSMPLTSIKFAPDAWGAAYSQTLFVSDCWGEVQKSGDDGASWTSLDPETDEWHWGLGLHPSDPSVLYATGNRQAMYKTTDGGATWQVAQEGLAAVIPEHLATVTGQPDTLYAVTDIGLLKGTGGGTAWQSLSAGLGNHGFVATDPFTPDRVYAAGGDVGMGSDMPIYLSKDGGQTWPITSYLTEPAAYDQYAHGNPILRPDPSQPGLLLAGVSHARIELGGDEAGSLYRSTDAGLTWAEVDVGQAISPVRDIAFDVASPTVVYLATSGDWYDAGTGLFRSTDRGLTWQRVGAAVTDLDQAESIAVEPRPPYRVFALANMRVYVSGDQGLTWTQTNIFHGAIQSLLSSHDRPDSILYIASGIGLLRSVNGGDTWGSAAGTLGQVPVYSLAEAVTADRTVLYAGTTGGYVQSRQGGQLVPAGVYRYTTVVPDETRIYLPLVLRESE
ncbi:MAG: IPT/TIG domain-containing protein [Anaerolineae bacterium]|nr:IPT/TIG domain-containing protein [Anaerolineae bacterium]